MRRREFLTAGATGLAVAVLPTSSGAEDLSPEDTRYDIGEFVLDKGATAVDAYFPRGAEWIDLWTGVEAGTPGTWSRMPAPLSKPAVFLRKGSDAATEVRENLKQAGILE